MSFQFYSRSQDIKELEPLSFTACHGKISVPGILIRKNGICFAYRNECRHLPITLDLAGGELMDVTRQYLQCQSHGAEYRIENGECIAGPCIGQHLERWVVTEEDGHVRVDIPLDPSSGLTIVEK